jgi:hypothetical protein
MKERERERLTELHERVRSARFALEALAERAAELRGRVELVRAEDPPFATVPALGLEQDGGGRDPFMPILPGGPLARSLERLTQGVRPLNAGDALDAGGDGDGDDGRFVSDAWEIALINEEGK